MTRSRSARFGRSAALLAGAVLVGTTLTGGEFAAPAAARSSGPAAAAIHVCAPVRLAATGQDLGAQDGVLHTTATVTLAGHVLGTTAAAFTPGAPSGTVLPFTGPIVFVPAAGPAGTLTAQVAGSVDLATGAFAATSTAVSGTGVFRPVTGHLTFTGTEDLATGAFTESITGRLCVR